MSAGSDLYFDNLFTSFPLLDKLSEMGISGTGTVRQNRLHRIPIIAKKDMEKKTVDRGTSEAVYNGDKVLVAWKDNKVSIFQKYVLYRMFFFIALRQIANSIANFGLLLFSGCVYGLQQVESHYHHHLPPLQ